MKNQNAKSDSSSTSETIRRNIETIRSAEHEHHKSLSLGEKMASHVAEVLGSMPSLYAHLVFYMSWLLINSKTFGDRYVFDPFPFGFLSTLAATEAIFLTIFVLVNQRRMREQESQRNHLHLQTTMLAEHELTKVLNVLVDIAERIGVSSPILKSDLSDLTENTDPGEILKTLEDQSIIKEKQAP